MILASATFGTSIALLVLAFQKTRLSWIYPSSLRNQRDFKDFSHLLNMNLKDLLRDRNKDLGWDDMLLSLAHELKAGASLENAVFSSIKRLKGEPKDYLERAYASYQSGLDMAGALEASAQGVYARDIAAIVDIGVVTGADMPVLFLSLADTLKEGRAFREEASAKLLEAKLTALLLSVLPWMLIGITEIMGTGSIKTVLSYGNGKAILLGAFFLWLLGTLLIIFLLKTAAPSGP